MSFDGGCWSNVFDGPAVVSALRHVPKPGYGLAPRSHTFSSAGGASSVSNIGVRPQHCLHFDTPPPPPLPCCFLQNKLMIQPFLNSTFNPILANTIQLGIFIVYKKKSTRLYSA